MRKPCVVVVEDNPDDREFLTRAVKAAGIDLDLRVFESGEEAIEYVRRKGTHVGTAASKVPNVIFLDVKLGRTTGFDVLHAIRQEVAFRHVPVVMFTSSDEECDVRMAYEMGANGYLQKSTDLSVAKERARVILTFWLHYNISTARFA